MTPIELFWWIVAGCGGLFVGCVVPPMMLLGVLAMIQANSEKLRK